MIKGMNLAGKLSRCKVRVLSALPSHIVISKKVNLAQITAKIPVTSRMMAWLMLKEKGLPLSL